MAPEWTPDPIPPASSAVPLHKHPEYRSFGQKGTVQSIPVAHANSVMEPGSVPALYAVKLTLPAKVGAAGVAVLSKPGVNVSGLWRAAVYSASGGKLPLAISEPSGVTVKMWQTATFQWPVPPAETDRDVWVVLETGGLAEAGLMHHKMWSPELVASLCYSTSQLTELPRELTFGGWTPEGRVPVVALN
ncbi:hypothetical protein Ppa06_58310 [Planomonospora parontospora subsp. parontospora]|uniref:Uncharacterized protein n=2 Tax=Planomonospora parontospora TaxID=58119 RepID=A0AA37BMA5_9ACTN|nr:hypothetical protein [Planomonospora parontospora]GGK90157.1 hypothetical protein GCM10010126_57000 [Planomonospora parontospora]GII12033.1 hypothetical protein Ppa06_58310 [Planomonospora parontospora subsp. parontospora]